MKKYMLGIVVAMLSIASAGAHADVRITEVAPWASGNSPYGADWFELTNIGSSALNISGWQVDDSSNGTGKIALTGITSIAAGESVIFTEGSISSSFINTWFGTNLPAGLQIGSYSGSGIGLSTSGDAVNIYNSTGVLQANVVFNSSDSTSPYQTFNNAAGLNNTTISLLSVVGVNGAFVAANDATEIGSPGFVATPVPEPESYALMLAGFGLIGAIARKRQRKA